MDRSVYDRMDQLEADHWWFSARRSIIQAVIERLVKLKSGAAILEAGCGTGGNLAMLRSLGDLDAFEYDQEARRRAEEKSGLSIAGGALPDELPYPGKSYDLIALFDVLEHVEEDRASLKALSSRLTPEGRILLTVPAYQWLWSKHDISHHHFRRYSKSMLREAAREAGLEVEHAFYFNSLLFPLAISMRALKAAIRSQTPDDDMPGPLANALLKRVFATERSFVGRLSMPFGLSLCAVLKPKQSG
jgi:SAM-dependent methyltransferase